MTGFPGGHSVATGSDPPDPKEDGMAKASQESASQVQDFGMAVDRAEELLGYTVEFVSIRQTHDLAPLLKGLPDDLCQCPHWGYLVKGRMTVHYLDHDEVIEAGDAFYLPPG